MPVDVKQVIAETFAGLLEHKNVEKIYRKLPEVLNEREKEIIILRYGLYNKKVQTQREIANRIGISRSYVSRIEKHALEKLKKRLNEE